MESHGRINPRRVLRCGSPLIQPIWLRAARTLGPPPCRKPANNLFSVQDYAITFLLGYERSSVLEGAVTGVPVLPPPGVSLIVQFPTPHPLLLLPLSSSFRVFESLETHRASLRASYLGWKRRIRSEEYSVGRSFRLRSRKSLGILGAERSRKACFVHRGRGRVTGIGGDHMVSRATAARPWSPSSLPRWLALCLARTPNSRPRGISNGRAMETWTFRIVFASIVSSKK